MVDEKFFEDYINDVEKVSSSNRYFIRGLKLNSTYVKHPKAEWIEDIRGKEFSNVLKSFTAKDRIFIHWYDLFIGKLMLTIEKNIPLYVSLMGGDFYADPILHNIGWLLDKGTLHYFKKRHVHPNVWARRPAILLKQLRKIREQKKATKKEFELKVKTIHRINFILVGEHMVSEVNLIKKMYKIDHIHHVPFILNQNFDLASTTNFCKRKSTVLNIQIGNSSSSENNHFDLLNKIKRFLKKGIKITIPLSYGDADYASFVKENYTAVFNGKVEYLQTFMSREDYVKRLQDIDVCIMYHNRSQALGNCITVLTLGKKLYLKKNNPLWAMFQRIGVLVFDAKTISNLSFEEFSQPLTQKQIDSNISNLSKTFSEKKRLENLAAILKEPN